MIAVKCNGERFVVLQKIFYKMRILVLEHENKKQNVDYNALKELTYSGRTKAPVNGCGTYYDIDTMERINAKGFIKKTGPAYS